MSLFIFSLAHGVLNIIDHYRVSIGYSENKLTDYFYILTNNTYYLRPSIILLIPILGIFIRRKIGWILIQSYFYFLMSNLLFTATRNDLNENDLILIYLIASLIFLLIIILMNKEKIRNLTYGIEKTELISMNIIASIIGASITLILVMIKNNTI